MEEGALLDRIRPMDPLNDEWVTAVILGVVVLMALINVSSPRKWRLLGQSMFRMRLGKQALREEMDLQDRTFLGLMLMGAVVLALFSWQTLVLVGRNMSFPVLVGMVAGVVLVHYVFLRTVGGILRSSPGVEEYIYTGFLIFILAGVLLLPLVAFMAYQATWRPWVRIGGMGILALLLLYRWFRGGWIGVGEGIPLRYIILYFCAAEILPVLMALHHWRSTSSPLFHS